MKLEGKMNCTIKHDPLKMQVHAKLEGKMNCTIKHDPLKMQVHAKVS